jgi:hypothetical protein
MGDLPDRVRGVVDRERKADTSQNDCKEKKLPLRAALPPLLPEAFIFISSYNWNCITLCLSPREISAKCLVVLAARFAAAVLRRLGAQCSNRT